MVVSGTVFQFGELKPFRTHSRPLFTNAILPFSIVMIGTLTGLQWMIYDSFKIFMGLPTTGGAAPPAEEKK